MRALLWMSGAVGSSSMLYSWDHCPSTRRQSPSSIRRSSVLEGWFRGNLHDTEQYKQKGGQSDFKDVAGRPLLAYPDARDRQPSMAESFSAHLCAHEPGDPVAARRSVLDRLVGLPEGKIYEFWVGGKRLEDKEVNKEEGWLKFRDNLRVAQGPKVQGGKGWRNH